jgi:hypothetical protein
VEPLQQAGKKLGSSKNGCQVHDDHQKRYRRQISEGEQTNNYRVQNALISCGGIKQLPSIDRIQRNVVVELAIKSGFPKGGPKANVVYQSRDGTCPISEYGAYLNEYRWVVLMERQYKLHVEDVCG